MSHGRSPSTEEARHARLWLGVAVASLVISGILSVVLVVGRLPGLHGLFPDPLFFRRGLVVHVDLALLVWFHAFFCVLAFALPAPSRPSLLARNSAWIGGLGVALLVATAGIPGAAPVLANYVPMIDHPLFVVALAVFGVAVLLAILDARVLFDPIDPSQGEVVSVARLGLRAGATTLLAAAVVFYGAALLTPRFLEASVYYELAVWGGGHVLQVASVCGMLVAWVLLLGDVLDRPIVSRRLAKWLFAALVVPMLLSPLLLANGTTHGDYRTGFTTLMRWGIFPVVSVVIALAMRQLYHATRAQGAKLLREPRVVSFLASAALTVTGFILGAMIRGSNTMVPGHYHAAIGAVTLAYMGVCYVLLPRLGFALPAGRLGRLARYQPAAFGVGQFVFAIGFSLAGAQGMARKAYGAEQQVRTAAESTGLIVMGVGGVVAVVAGVLFLAIVIRAWLGHAPVQAMQGEVEWKAERIQSKG